jgi:hypothetical protein
MNPKQSKEILGDRASWELQNMKRALSKLQIMNTEEENLRLEAVNVALKELRKARK